MRRTDGSARRTQGILGGRSEQVVRRVLDAAIVELARSGYAGFRMDAVASLAAVNKTTIYRRWPTPQALLVDALDSRSDRDAPAPNTGSLRVDLRTFGQVVHAKLISEQSNAMLKRLVSVVHESPEVLDKVRRILEEAA